MKIESWFKFTDIWYTVLALRTITRVACFTTVIKTSLKMTVTFFRQQSSLLRGFYSAAELYRFSQAEQQCGENAVSVGILDY